MRAVLFSLLLAYCSMLQAGHCERDEVLPDRFKRFALGVVKDECPALLSGAEPMVVEASFNSWDMEQYYTIRFRGQGGLEVSVKVGGHCTGHEALWLESLRMDRGCH